MKRLTILVCLLSFAVFSAWSQESRVNVKAVLESIEKNNPQLNALRKNNEASIAELKTQNTLGETNVEFSPFFRNGTDGMASSELVVSQDFDFPTLYASRRKSVLLQQGVLEQDYLVLRRDLFLQAQNLCADLTTALENAQLIGERMNAVDSLLNFCDKRLKYGNATIMELNRVKMDRMTVRTELVQNDGEKNRLLLELAKLGAKDVQYVSDSTAWANEDLKGCDEARALAAVESAKHEVKVSQQGWLPKLSVGYRRNTEAEENALNGMLVGLSFPLFSNSQKVKATRLRQSATEQEMENMRLQIENRKQTLLTEAENLRRVIDAYDVPLMKQSLNILMRAVKAGELSIMDYYTEADKVNAMLQTRLSAVNRYNKVLSELSAY